MASIALANSRSRARFGEANAVQLIIGWVGGIGAIGGLEQRITRVGDVVVSGAYRIRIDELSLVRIRQPIGALRNRGPVIELHTFGNAGAAEHQHRVLDTLLGIGQVLIVFGHAVIRIGWCEKATRIRIRLGRRRRTIIRAAVRRSGTAGIQAADVEVMILLAFPIARHQEAQVKTVEFIGPGVDFATDAIALTMIIVAAQIEFAEQLVRHALRLLIAVSGFNVVDPALIVVINAGQQNADRARSGEQAADAIAAIETAADGAIDIEHRRIAQRFIAAASAAFDEQLAAVLIATARHQIDRAAERFGIEIGPVGLGQFNAADQAGRQHIESRRAAAAERRSRVRWRQAHTAVSRAIEIGIQPANADKTTFAGIGFQRYAGQPLQGFGGIDVRQFADFFQRLHFDQVRRLLLFRNRRRAIPRRARRNG